MLRASTSTVTGFNMTKVLCRLPNHVGDCCMALPALRLLEASGFEPVLTGKRWAEDLLAGMEWRFDPIEGHVTEVLTRIRHLARHVGEKPLGLLFPNSFSSALLYRIGGIRSAGFPTDGRGFLLDQKIPEPAPMHEVERFFAAARGAILAWGGTPAWENAPKEIGLRVLKRHEAAARNLIKEHNIAERFALLAPVARGLHHGKKKSWDHFNALCGPLRDMGVEPIVFPSPHEEDEARAACPDARILPPTTLGNYAALCRLAAVVIANDSGVSHVAAAVGAPQITLIGVTEPTRTSPWNENAVLLGSDTDGWPSVHTVLGALQRKLDMN